MPVQNYWLVENRILMTELQGSITADDLMASSQIGTQMIESGVAPVYSLVDMSQIIHYPMRLSDFTTLFEQPSSKKLAWIIIFGIPNTVASFLSTTFAHIVAKNYKVTKTREEALALVEKLEGAPIPPSE